MKKVLEEEYVTICKSCNKYREEYDKNKESLYLKYWDVNNLYGWAMSQKFPVNKFEWIEDASQFNEDFMKNYHKESDKGDFLEVDVLYLEKLHKLYNDLSFLLERMKIEKVVKLVTNLHDRIECVLHLRNVNNKFWKKFMEWLSLTKKLD